MSTTKKRPAWMFPPDTIKKRSRPDPTAMQIVPETAKEKAERLKRLESSSGQQLRDWQHYYARPVKRCRYCRTRSRIGYHKKDCQALRQGGLF